MKRLFTVFSLLILFLFSFEPASFAFQQILSVPGLGKVEADTARHQLIFTAFRPGRVPMEYSIWTHRSYKQSEAGGWAKPQFRPAVKRERLPHYITFIVTIARYGKIGSAICRENDGRVGCNIFR